MSKNGSVRKALVSIQRFYPGVDETPYYKDYEIAITRGMTILDALHYIKTELDGSLTYRRSCRHGICGSCGMNINGGNMLACESPLAEHLDSSGKIVIRPLSYLPVIKDLVVDRETFWDQYMLVKPWLISPSEFPENEFRVSPEAVGKLGNAEKCIMCGVCYSACPVINVDKGFVGPHAMLKAKLRVHDTRDVSQDDHMAGMGTVWDCTTCYACVDQCPKELDPGMVAPEMRSIFVEDNKVPPQLGAALMSTFRQNNPFEMPHQERMDWAKELSLADAFTEDVDSLYFVCCMGCYDPRVQKSSQAMVRVMDAAGVALGTMGSEEMCCGSEIRRVGEMGLWEMILEERTELLNSASAKQMVTSSPHCFDVYAKQYVDLEKEIKHYTQFVSEMVKDGGIIFNGEVNKKVAYHDPCFLGRQNGIYDEPRDILSSIPGVELIEMERSRETSLCCGGGGGRMWYEGEGEGHMSHERLREAVETGAEVLATACPFCMNMFDDAIKTLGLGDKIQVKDIMELVEEGL